MRMCGKRNLFLCCAFFFIIIMILDWFILLELRDTYIEIWIFQNVAKIKHIYKYVIIIKLYTNKK